jgi:hypothetical protein
MGAEPIRAHRNPAGARAGWDVAVMLLMAISIIHNSPELVWVSLT